MSATITKQSQGVQQAFNKIEKNYKKAPIALKVLAVASVALSAIALTFTLTGFSLFAAVVLQATSFAALTVHTLALFLLKQPNNKSVKKFETELEAMKQKHQVEINNKEDSLLKLKKQLKNTESKMDQLQNEYVDLTEAQNEADNAISEMIASLEEKDTKMNELLELTEKYRVRCDKLKTSKKQLEQKLETLESSDQSNLKEI